MSLFCKVKVKAIYLSKCKRCPPIISTSLNLGYVLRSGNEWDTASVLMGSLSFSDRINGRTQATQQSEKNILSKDNTSRSNSIGWNWPLSSSCLHITSFLCLLLPDGLLPPQGRKAFCQEALCIYYSIPLACLKLLKCLRFCSTAWLAAEANKRIQGQHFLFLI